MNSKNNHKSKHISGFGKYFALALIISSVILIGQARVWAVSSVVLPIYDDALAAGWQDWSWDTSVDFDNAAPIDSGAASAAVTLNAAWAGFSLRAPAPLNTAGYTAIAFSIYGGEGSSQLQLYTQSTDDGAPGTGYDLTAPAGDWTPFTVTLTALGDPSAIARITLQDRIGAAQPTFYLDNLQLLGASPGGLPPEKWALWQDGPHLRGANIYQRRSYPDADGPELSAVGPVIPPYTQEDFDKLAAMGANYVNISHPGLFREAVPYTVDLDIQNNLDQLLEKIAQANLYVVISFRTGPGRNEFIFLNEEDPAWLVESRDINFLWTDQAAQDAWVEMWRYTAERYGDDPIVAGYDLMVEPNANALLNIWDPAVFYPAYAGALYDWNQLYPEISAAIREVDPATPILIGAMSYSAVSWLPYLQPTGDPYTIYTVHQYEPFVYTHLDPPLNLAYPGTFDADYDGLADAVNQAWLDNLLLPIDTFKLIHNVPVAVNEYGLKRWQLGGAQFMADEMALFEERGLNHAWWLWAPSDERFIEYTHPFNLLLGPDPDSRAEVAASELLEAIKENWSLNVLRPDKDTYYLFLPIIIKPG